MGYSRRPTYKVAVAVRWILGVYLHLMAWQGMSTTGCSGQPMARSSIRGDNMSPCIQLGIIKHISLA